jgi:hypothetical protein
MGDLALYPSRKVGACGGMVGERQGREEREGKGQGRGRRVGRGQDPQESWQIAVPVHFRLLECSSPVTCLPRFSSSLAHFCKAVLEVIASRLIDKPVGGSAAAAIGDSISFVACR